MATVHMNIRRFIVLIYFPLQPINCTALHPKLHRLSLAPQKNIGMASRRTNSVIAAISLSAKRSPEPAIQELVVADSPKPMMARKR